VNNESSYKNIWYSYWYCSLHICCSVVFNISGILGFAVLERFTAKNLVFSHLQLATWVTHGESDCC
jgi:hypothetical protein